MNIHKLVTEQRIINLIEDRNTSLSNPGLCIACGVEADECEPDARKYECEFCEKKTVFAPEELLMSGHYHQI